MVPSVIPQLVASNGTAALRAAIADPDRYACEPKVDGVRGLIVFGPDGALETRNRRGIRRDWLRGDAFEGGLRRLGNGLPILWNGTVLDGELTAGRFQTTMVALFGSKRHRPDLRLVVFGLPSSPGPTSGRCRGTSDANGWSSSRRRSTFRSSCHRSSRRHAVLLSIWRTGVWRGSSSKDRTSPYKDGTRAGWHKVKDPSWIQREAWRFDRR
jgi:hypothetical protein